MLLGSRGRRPSRSGFGQRVRSAIDGWFGRSRWRRERGGSSGMLASVPGWVAGVIACGAFAGGYLVHAAVAPGRSAKEAQLSVPDPGQSPTFLESGTLESETHESETTPLAREGFVVAAYPNQKAEVASDKARRLAAWLREHGFDKARAYEYQTGQSAGRSVGAGLWTVFVYYDGAQEAADSRERLLALPEDVPDPMFVHLRKQLQNSGDPWPAPWQIR
jgi:hypothetical protein